MIFFSKLSGLKKHWLMNQYKFFGMYPWKKGYYEYKDYYLNKAIEDPLFLDLFNNNESLPLEYGYRIDSRAVEIPWFISKLDNNYKEILDVGGSLNFQYIITHERMENKKLTVITLDKSEKCYLRYGVSYILENICDFMMNSSKYDIISCISTIEHIGMNNSIYTSQKDDNNITKKKEYLDAINNMKRLLKPGGSIYITLPFGKYEDHGWLQQFDSLLVDELIASFPEYDYDEKLYKYEESGWKKSSRIECVNCQYFDIHKVKSFPKIRSSDYPDDCPAAERAVLCIELKKPGSEGKVL